MWVSMVLWSVFGQLFLCFCTFAYVSRAMFLSAQLMLFKEVIGLHKNSYRDRYSVGRPLGKVTLYSWEKAFFLDATWKRIMS